MRPTDRIEIRRLALFRDMLETHFETLLSRAYAQAFPAELELFRQGDPADFLHVVLDGKVELFSTWADRQCTMAVVGPTGAFILAACIRDAPYLMSARTLGRARILMIPAADLRAIFRKDSEFAVAVIHELAGAYRAVVRHAKGLKLRNSRERVASYLLRQSAVLGDAPSYQLPIEKRHLASYLGMTPENLSRNLRSLRAAGVKVDGARVIITDRAKLRALVRPDPLLDGPDPEAVAASLPRPEGQGEQTS